MVDVKCIAVPWGEDMETKAKLICMRSETNLLVDHSEICDRYNIRRKGGVRLSESYPFIFLIYNPYSGYNDNIDVRGDGSFSEVHYKKSNNGFNDNEALEHHYNLNGVYHSVFLFQKVYDKMKYLGEYELYDVDSSLYKLRRIPEISLDDNMVYFAEKDNPKELEILDDIDDIIDGNYKERKHILDNDGTGEIREGMFLDSKFSIIDLGRIINLNMAHYGENGNITLEFRLGTESSMAERRVSQHLCMLSRFNDNIQNSSTNQNTDDEKSSEEKAEEVKLYTVNVGCALTNFMILKYQSAVKVWVFDWGSGDGFTTDAKENINDCIKDIQKTYFGGKQFFVDKLFISHADSDHYNRIDKELLNTDTEVWLSGYCLVNGNFTTMLSRISKKTNKYIMPFKSNSKGIIRIHHPIKPIVFGINYCPGCYITKKKNNMSPIIEICIRDRKIVFTGDIETAGWFWFKNDSACSGIDTDIYLHSHHGSVNGFITNIPNKGNSEFDTVTFKVDLLSTQSNIHNNVPSNNITSDIKYAKTYSTELVTRNLKYYITDIFACTVKSVYRS